MFEKRAYFVAGVCVILRANHLYLSEAGVYAVGPWSEVLALLPRATGMAVGPRSEVVALLPRANSTKSIFLLGRGPLVGSPGTPT